MKHYVIIFLVLISLTASAQTGGRYAYSFLDLVTSPRIASLGGTFLAVNDIDINIAVKSPSLIDEQIHNNLAFSFTDYYAGINIGSVAYARSFKKYGSFATALNFVNYGKFLYTDQTGEILGTFTAGDYVYTLGWGRHLSPVFSMGSNLKLVYSKLESYSSFGLAIDLSANYTSKDKDLCIVLNTNYIGTQIKPYISGQRSKLPFEIQAGISKKLKHMPFMFSLLAIHLEQPNLAFNDPFNPVSKTNPLSGEVETKSKISQISDKIIRHAVIGGELNLAKVMQVRLGYNYQRRQEMKINDKEGMVGFSWGIGIKIKGFQLDYARSAYHLAGSPNYLCITKNLNDFVKK